MLNRLKSFLRWKRESFKYAKLCNEHPLRYLFLEITRRCNLKCIYCGSECLPGYNEDELETSQWISFVRQIASDFDPKNVMVAVTGGEPLIKEGIFDIFNELKSLGFPFGMVSNGTLIDAQKADKIVKTGIGSISISMDAPSEINDSLRGQDVSKRAELAIENLKAAGYKGKMEIISTITKPAVPYLEEMRRYVSKLKVPLWRVAPVMPIGRAAKRKNLVPDADDVKTILEFVKNSRTDKYIPRPEFSEEGYLGEDYEGLVRPYLCQCRAGITVAGIRSDGRIGACPELSDEFIQGHISKDRFRKTWAEKYKEFRDRSWTKKGKCADCKMYSRCNGGSLHLYPAKDSDFLRCLYLMLEGSNKN